MATSKRATEARRSRANNSAQALRCRRKFLRFFPAGFRDETYIDWERGYKWTAHEPVLSAFIRGQCLSSDRKTYEQNRQPRGWRGRPGLHA